MTVDDTGNPRRPIIPLAPGKTGNSVAHERRSTMRRLDLAARLIEGSAYVFARQSEAKVVAGIVRLSADVVDLAKSLADENGRGNP